MHYLTFYVWVLVMLLASLIMRLYWPEGTLRLNLCHVISLLFNNNVVKCVIIMVFLSGRCPPPTAPILQSSVECLRENLCSLSPQSVGSQLEALVERTEDFTDSAYTSHEQRQAILGLCQLARQDAQQLVHAWAEAVCWHKQIRLHRCSYAHGNIHKKKHMLHKYVI